jgi:bifunctional non-homologous end joining protein LigD
MKWRDDPAKVRPMLATLADPPLTSPGLVYEPKYDGIRAIVHIPPGHASDRVRMWSRLGNEKTSQFPSVVRALDAFRATLEAPLLLDGEIAALDEHGRPAGFQRLQGRIHLTGAREVEEIDRARPVALIAFDLLRDGDEDLRGLPLAERRARLEAVLQPALGAAARPAVGSKSPGKEDESAPRFGTAGTLRISEQAAGDGRALQARARNEGWEGLIVKDSRAPYQSGRRSPAWRKLKLVRQQEFIVGGWTEPRQTRAYFGALLLGVRESKRPDALTYVGHTGTGFNEAELARVWKLLKSREAGQSPFSERIKTNEPAHWVRPDLVAQVRFTEWTDDGKLRHPVYLGLRDDKRAEDVVREEKQGMRSQRKPPSAPRETKMRRVTKLPYGPVASVISQLRALEEARRDGTIELPGGERLGVTNLSKIFWPAAKLTKGDLLRYYATVSEFILPAVADRPLVMKRFPNGIGGMAFYQQRSRQEKPPAGVRIETLPKDIEPISEDDARRFIGGSLITLLYMTQIAAISQDPWFSRVPSLLDADYTAIDLDPGEHTPFSRVLEVARWVHDELETLGVPAVPKTSGSSGLHIYIPLPPGTSYESGMLFCQIVATVVAARHPRAATVERTVRARPRGTVYVDYLQNILGKTLATVYSARASEFAGVSTPLTWKEVHDGVDPRAFTIVTAPERFREVGDLWARLRTTKPANLEVVFRKYQSAAVTTTKQTRGLPRNSAKNTGKKQR